jgi:hypothetical protein
VGVRVGVSVGVSVGARVAVCVGISVDINVNGSVVGTAVGFDYVPVRGGVVVSSRRRLIGWEGETKSRLFGWSGRFLDCFGWFLGFDYLDRLNCFGGHGFNVFD